MTKFEKELTETPTETEMTLHAILAGILLNGFTQGKVKHNLDSSVLKQANKTIIKLFKK